MSQDKARRRVQFLVPRPPVSTTRLHFADYGEDADALPFGGLQGHSRERLVAYGYYDLAELKGVDPGSVRRAESDGRLKLDDLLSVARYVYDRRICRCCQRPMLPSMEDEDPPPIVSLELAPSREPTGPPAALPLPASSKEQICPLCWDGSAFTCGRYRCDCPCHAR